MMVYLIYMAVFTEKKKKNRRNVMLQMYESRGGALNE